MAIKTDGSLWAWGSNFYNQLGNGKGGFTLKKNEDGGFFERIAICQKSPVKIMENVASVSASDRFTMAIKTDGTLWAWGWNSYGQIGNNGKGNTEIDGIPIQTKPVRILYNAALVSTGSDYAMAVKTDGTLWAWGVNDYGQLGFDRTDDSSKWGEPYQSVPKKVMDAVATDKVVAKPSASAALVVI